MANRNKAANMNVAVKAPPKLNRAQRGKQIANMRKRQITRAAYEVIAQKGYYNFTMMDIAKQAGVSSGLIHHYFKDKENMLVTLLREMQQNVRESFERKIEFVTDPRRKLEILVDWSFEVVESEREYLHVIFDFMTQIKFNERMRRILRKLYHGYRESCYTILKEGQEKGIFIDMDADFFATFCVGAVLGVREQYVIDDTAFNYLEYAEKVKNTVFNMILVK